MDGSLIIMEGSLLSTFLLLQWMVALSLMDGHLVIMEGILLSMFLLLQWMVGFHYVR